MILAGIVTSVVMVFNPSPDQVIRYECEAVIRVDLAEPPVLAPCSIVSCANPIWRCPLGFDFAVVVRRDDAVPMVGVMVRSVGLNWERSAWVGWTP